MLYRNILQQIMRRIKAARNSIVIIDGARCVGKTYLVRYIGRQYFDEYVEINMLSDSKGKRYFESIGSCQQVYDYLENVFGLSINGHRNVLVVLDEIQVYPGLLTLLKFLAQEGKFVYIATGTSLRLALLETPSIPMGYTSWLKMDPLDFEEFLLAFGWKDEIIRNLKGAMQQNLELDESMIRMIKPMLELYIQIGGFPKAIQTYLETFDMNAVRRVQQEVMAIYRYEMEAFDMLHHAHCTTLFNNGFTCIRSYLDHGYGGINVSFTEHSNEIDYFESSRIMTIVRPADRIRFPLIDGPTCDSILLFCNDVGLVSMLLDFRKIKDDRWYLLFQIFLVNELASVFGKIYYRLSSYTGRYDFLINDFERLCPVSISVSSYNSFVQFTELTKVRR